VDVVGLGSGITAVAAGGTHTCALTSSGGVKCWGLNIYGQLGDGTNIDRYTPVDVVGLGGGVDDVTVGYEHTCVLTSSSRMKCWGLNIYGQLGDGTNIDRYTPVDVVGLMSGVAEVTAGSWHTCAVISNGGVKCWGLNDYNQLGDGTNNNSNTPVDVYGLEGGLNSLLSKSAKSLILTSSISSD
jgi:alpha-tubulin suppressor-like RCC1 family protein